MAQDSDLNTPAQLEISLGEYVRGLFPHYNKDIETVALMTALPTGEDSNGKPVYSWPAKKWSPRSRNASATHAMMCSLGDAVTGAGNPSRVADNLMRAHNLQFDDAGSKGNKTPPVKPTAIIQTNFGSPDAPNFTYIYTLDEPTTDLDLFKRVLFSLKEAEYLDENCWNPTHVNRLPGSLPALKEYPAKLISWHPELRFKLEELLDLFNVEEQAIAAGAQDYVATPAPPGTVVEDEVLAWLKAEGLIEGEMEHDGWYKITCPWQHMHSDGRAVAKYNPATEDDIKRVFHCHHTHVQSTTLFLDWVHDQGGPRCGTAFHIDRNIDDLAVVLRAAGADLAGVGPLDVAQARVAPPAGGDEADLYEQVAARFGGFNAAHLPAPKFGSTGKLRGVQVADPRNIAWVVRTAGASKRFNMMSQTTEWHFNDTLGDLMADKQTAVQIGAFKLLANQCDISPGAAESALEDIDAIRYHPMEEWILANPKWDGVDRIKQITNTMPVDIDEDGYNDYLHAILRRWFIQAVQAVRGWREQEQEIPHVLVLCGGQGAGKTSWIKELAPPQFTDGGIKLHFGGGASGDRDAVRKATQRAIVELGELETTFSKSGQGELKNFLSGTADTYRPAYGRNEITVRRCTVFAASANRVDILRDGTGARRYWPISLKDGKRIIPRITEHAQLWAQANTLWEAGETWHLTPAEEDLHDLFAAAHQEATEVSDMMADEFPNGFFSIKAGQRGGTLPDGCEVLNVTDILKRIDVRGVRARDDVKDYIAANGGKLGKYTKRDGTRSADGCCIAYPATDDGMKMTLNWIAKSRFDVVK